MLSHKIFRKILQISSKKFDSEKDSDRVLIAEDYELASIFDDVITTTINLLQKASASDEAFYILDLAADDAAFGNGFGVEKLDYPAVRSDVNR